MKTETLQQAVPALAMKMALALPLVLALTLPLAWSTPAFAQPADLPIPAATTTQYPSGVRVVSAASGPVYANRSGQVLYGMDMRTVLRWSPDAAQFCQSECQQEWEPLLAPSGAKANIRFPLGFGDRRPSAPVASGQAASPRPSGPTPISGPPPLPEGFVQPQSAPDWSVINGPQGLQWVYKGWHMVYVRKGAKAGSTDFDGSSDMTWNTLKFVPPMPVITAPSGVQPMFHDGGYILADKDGRALFTGQCKQDCDAWAPLAAGMAGSGTGQWTVDRSGDSPQWRHRGKPVFTSRADDPLHLPTGAKALRP